NDSGILQFFSKQSHIEKTAPAAASRQQDRSRCTDRQLCVSEIRWNRQNGIEGMLSRLHCWRGRDRDKNDCLRQTSRNNDTHDGLLTTTVFFKAFVWISSRNAVSVLRRSAFKDTPYASKSERTDLMAASKLCLTFFK